MSTFIGGRFDRNIGIWNDAFQSKIAGVKIGVVGLGGAGGALVALLARNGFGRFKLADYDSFELHNIQRQEFAYETTIGQPKLDVTESFLKDINPALEIERWSQAISEKNAREFVEGCDFVHEVVDLSVPGAKLAIHRAARSAGVIATTSAMLGAGVATWAFSPQGVTYEECFGEVLSQLDPADLVDAFLRPRPDYIDIPFYTRRIAARTIPTTADAAMLAAVSTAAIYKRILLGKSVAFAPATIRVDLMDDRMYESSIFSEA
jgi:tRNA threonylcarbamoyladenosine dehydratase